MLYVDPAVTSTLVNTYLVCIAIGMAIGMIIFGTLCAIVAKSKRRSAVGWFVLGALFGLIPLIIVACLPSKQY